MSIRYGMLLPPKSIKLSTRSLHFLLVGLSNTAFGYGLFAFFDLADAFLSAGYRLCNTRPISFQLPEHRSTCFQLVGSRAIRCYVLRYFIV